MKNYGTKLGALLYQQLISDDFDEKWMKIKFDGNYDLALKKLEIYNMVMVFRSVPNEGNKYYPHVFQSMLV